MPFKDRIDAGKKLAKALSKYSGSPHMIVIGLPRGGVPVAYEVAKWLDIPLDIVCPRKIGAPGNKEFAIGAITETGETIFDNNLIDRLGVYPEYLQEETEKEKQCARYRLNLYRKERPPRNLAGKKVIIVDDGLATGATMKAAIKTVKNEKASMIIVAIPVSPPDTLDEISALVNEVECLEAPLYFQAVGQYYDYFEAVEDEEVIELLQQSLPS